MASPYVGEIKMFAGSFAPDGWLNCDGSMLSTSGDYQALYTLIGNTYGGSGGQFALPDLRGCVAVGIGALPGGSNYTLGQTGGVENVTLSGLQVPVHTHQLMATSSGQQQSPANAIPASVSSPYMVYGPKTSGATTLQAASVGSNSGGGSHPNIQPYLGMRYIIAWMGIYPTFN